MPYRRYKRTDPRRYTTHARLVIAGHLKGPAMLCLSLITVTWTVMGVSILSGAASRDDALIHTVVPDWLRIAWWIIPAILCLYTLVTGRHTTVTVAALTIAPTVRIVSYLWAWISYLIPGAPDGLATAWYSAAFHVVMLGLVVLTSMLTQSDEPRRTPEGGDRP